MAKLGRPNRAPKRLTSFDWNCHTSSHGGRHECESPPSTWVPRVVYGLVSSNARNVVRYVGSTNRPASVRLSAHLSGAKKRASPLAMWIQEVLDAGHTVELVVLRERACIQCELEEIARRVSLREPLVNVLGNELRAIEYSAKMSKLMCGKATQS